MEINTRKNKKHCCVEHKELWRYSDRQTWLMLAGWLRLHGRWEFAAMVDRSEHEPKHVVLNTSDKEDGEDGVAGYGKGNQFEQEEQGHWSIQVHIQGQLGPFKV